MIPTPQVRVPGDVPDWARDLAAATNSALSIIAASLNRTVATVYVPTQSPTVANQPFIVTHSLNAIPKMVSSLSESTAQIYATAEDKKEWSKTQVKVRCSKANAMLVLRVE